MKKFIAGTCFGIVISLSSVAVASDTIQALLFPAAFEVNGNTVSLPDDYSVLNVQGHAYVPIRFAAEHLGANIDYDPKEQRIIIKNEPLQLIDATYPQVTVGNIIAVDSGANTRVTGQLQLEGTDDQAHIIDAYLSFQDEHGTEIGVASIAGSAYKRTPLTFETMGYGHFGQFSSVLLHIIAVNERMIADPTIANPLLLTKEQALSIGMTTISQADNPVWSALLLPAWSVPLPDQQRYTKVWVITALYSPYGNRQTVTIDAVTGALLSSGDYEGHL
ncbi:hypothetical protein A8709_20045 [Paenibacillus pectinilyticus]|uniref:Copper amine oxidase-like N-terminal domain-containing protein n=1 Tax=Paenibacillus pectinilyticus TaxID=512399 RepID=A0A1C1A0E7_9BACL|nr:stalk domain-containing protein [Paenibacillus pectinilyticus]OCT13867.1 hypothetical protein A8709_20045 [Paenibacillus pectinilyticus]